MSPKRESKRPKEVPRGEVGGRPQGTKTIHPDRKKFSDWAEGEAQRRAQTVKVLPKGVLPLVTGPLPQVSAVPEKGLVSGKPPITIPRYCGILPSRKWGKTRIPVTRKIRALRPTEVGLFETLVNVVGAPMSIPTHIVNGMVNLSNTFQGQAEEERLKRPEDKIKDELLELKMRYEMDEISENNYNREEAKLKRRLKDLEEGRGKKSSEGSPQERSLPKRGRKQGIIGEKPKKKKKKKPKKGKKKK